MATPEGIPHARFPGRERRRFVLGGALAAAGLATGAAAQDATPSQAVAPSRQRLPLADMHSHYGMFLPRLFGLDLARHLADTGTVLLAWSVTDDHRWIAVGGGGWRQTRVPAPGELWENFQRRLAGYEEKRAAWGVPRALTPADVDAALAGQPMVLMATEGANFLEGRVERLAEAHAWGIRHLQLVHFIQSPLGDHQTAEPRHGGLTPTGVEVVRACRRLGIVVDLAHGTAGLVDAALDATDRPLVWSHSWISPQGGTWQDVPYVARSLAPASARRIAAAGGVVGLWSVRVRGDPAYPVHSVRAYAEEILRMADLIGPAHVAFGTDMEGAGPGPILSDYVDLRAVADLLAQRGLAEADLRGIFAGNYARVVQAAMRGATAS
ncbi:dipeptidase [Ramlibacter sp.]|uniref:dipeptidase n=1 Tax=Ramlibacter sp. TaxID=1917967 RepID=UPI0035B36231